MDDDSKEETEAEEDERLRKEREFDEFKDGRFIYICVKGE